MEQWARFQQFQRFEQLHGRAEALPVPAQTLHRSVSAQQLGGGIARLDAATPLWVQPPLAASAQPQQIHTAEQYLAGFAQQPSIPPVTIPDGFTAIPSGAPPFLAAIDNTSFTFAGIPAPPISDPQIVSLRSILPSVDPRVMKKILEESYTPYDILLLLPHELRGKAKVLFKDDFLDMANVSRDPYEFEMKHLLPALLHYGAILVYFAPASAKSALAISYNAYVIRLLLWSDRYYFRAVLSFHIHFHSDLIARKCVYTPEAWREDAGNLVASYITPAVRPASYIDGRKRPRSSDLPTGSSSPRRPLGNGSTTSFPPRVCWFWNLGQKCKVEPCGLRHVCSLEGCGAKHRACDHPKSSR
jgi:hypothetical protein